MFELEGEGMEFEKKSGGVSNMGAWAMNIISSVGIIMANKQLMSSDGYAFTFGLFLLLPFLIHNLFLVFNVSQFQNVSAFVKLRFFVDMTCNFTC